MVTTTSSTSSTTTTTATDSASLGSALATSIGGGTGIDMTDLATKIADAQFLSQNQKLTNQQTKVALQISQASQLKSDLLTLTQSIGTAIDGGNLVPAPTVTNSAVASASLPLGSAGSAASYSLEVTALAKPQVLTSAQYGSATAATGSGTLTIKFGTVSASSFAEDTTHAAVNVTTPSGATLADVASAINGAGAGISAYVATDANGSRLVMKGKDGAANGFTLSASENASDPGLAALAWTPATGDATRKAQGASDAAFKLDGIARTSASNTITNAAPGLSLKLTGTNTGAPTTVTYNDPSANITTAMQNITTALNSLVGELNTDKDPTNGGLYNDSGAKSMSRKLSTLASTIIMPHAATGEPSTLGDLGLKVAKDGTFSLDGAKLASALASNPAAVAAMFTKGLYGVYGTMQNITQSLTSSLDPSSLTGSVTRYTRLQTSLTKQQTTATTQQSKLREQLISQYANANALVAQSKSTLSYLQNQVAAWNKTTN